MNLVLVLLLFMYPLSWRLTISAIQIALEQPLEIFGNFYGIYLTAKPEFGSMSIPIVFK